MSSNTDFGGMSFDMPKNRSNVIKVIGVGGGGSNAINHMFKSGIVGVDFVICNTDAQALQNSPVPNKIQLGVSLTEGLGAGADPNVGEESAIESFDKIAQMLDTNTKMVFITAGMGGGTGTGAAPIIAKMAKDSGVLTVGIVTVPFIFEGKKRNEQAQIGIEKLRKEVDSLIVINNNKLREVYGNLGFKAGFAKADEVLATAAKSIAEVITHHYIQNIDLRDARTVLENGGSAIMGSAIASGAGRAQEAITKALDSPLLNDNRIIGAKNVLLLILSGEEEITMDEMAEISEHIQIEAGHGANIIQGVGEDETLVDGAISVTVVATGFEATQQDVIANTETKKIIHTLGDNKAVTQVLSAKNVISDIQLPKKVSAVVEEVQQEVKAEIVPEKPVVESKIIHNLFEDEEQEVATPPKPSVDLVETTEVIKNIDVVYDEVLAPAILLEEEFIITNITEEDSNIEEVKETAAAIEDEQIAFSFDMPAANTAIEMFEPVSETQSENTPETAAEITEVKDAETPIVEAEKIVYTLEDEIAEIEVNEPTEIVSVTEHNESGIKKYALEVEEEVTKTETPTTTTEAFVFEKKVSTPIEEVSIPNVEVAQADEAIDPFDMSIDEANKLLAEGRKRNLARFNYNFRSNINKNIDEIEKQPAFKRNGVDLDTHQSDANISRTTLGTDENDDIQLRSNNSFLHDNVD